MDLLDDMFKEHPLIVAQEELIVDTMEWLCETMGKYGVSRSDLAKELGVSKSRITKILNGSNNVTLRTLSDLFNALGVRIEVREKENKSKAIINVSTVEEDFYLDTNINEEYLLTKGNSEQAEDHSSLAW